MKIINQINGSERLAGIAWLLLSMLASPSMAEDRGDAIPQVQLLKEFRPIGGSGNNLEHPNLDPVPGSPEISLTPPNFAPGTIDGLIKGPNPRIISNVIAGGQGANGQNAQTQDPVASAWLYVFGQFVDHDISLEATPPTAEAIDIPIPKNDPVFSQHPSIAMTRDIRSPDTNTIINTVAGYLDLSQLYGSDVATAASLLNPDGTLKSTGNGAALPIVNDQFVTGDPRVMENPELTAVTILFMREHNFWVNQLKAQHDDWTPEQLYNMAKAITTAEYQNIIYEEYLPVLIGPVLDPYTGYNPRINAQATQEFTTAAFRVGHSQVSDTQEGIDNNGNVIFTESLAQSFFNTPEIDLANGFDPLLRSLSVDFSQDTDVYVVEALRNLLFAGLVGGEIDQVDLIAIDIQRERDVGLGTLNQARQEFGFPRYKSIADLTGDPVLRKNLGTVYGNIDNIDLFMGGLAERHAFGAAVGPTFQAIIASQFQALRDGDRFFWLNEGFDQETAGMIACTTLAELLKRNAGATNLQAHVFLAAAPAAQVKLHKRSSTITTHGRSLPAPFPQSAHQRDHRKDTDE
jgi:peroxidase